MYCRWENGVHPRESLLDLMVASKDHINSLEDHIRLLQKRIKILEAKASSSGVVNGTVSEIVQDNRLTYKKNVNDEVLSELVALIFAIYFFGGVNSPP